MRVLHLISDTDRRGGQVFASDLHDAFGRVGIDSEVVALRAGSVGGLDVDVVGGDRRAPATYARVRRLMASRDITIAHGSTTVLACAVAGMGPTGWRGAGAGHPFVTRQLSETAFWVNTRSRRLRVSAYLRRSRLVVALAPGAATELERIVGVAPEKIRVVPNGVPATRFVPPTPDQRQAARESFDLAPDAVVVAVVGALVPEKGVDRLIDAAADVPEVTLLIAGDGPARADLQRRAAERAVSARFAGSVPDPERIYQAGDAFAMASRTENMPGVIIEASFSGLPTVANSVGAIGELVVDGETGWLLGPDDRDGLTGAFRSLLDAGERRRRGGLARTFALERFEIDVVARAWENVLEEAIRRP